MIYFIGAGPGDPELLTIKGKKCIDRADVIIYAGSLVNEQVIETRKPEAKVYNSAYMTLEQVLKVMEKAPGQGLVWPGSIQEIHRFSARSGSRWTLWTKWNPVYSDPWGQFISWGCCKP